MAAWRVGPRRVRLLIDEMYTPAVAEQLRARGHDALAVREVLELRALPDRALLEWATADGRAVFTENVSDFLALHAACLQSGTRHTGIVLASNAAFPHAGAGTIGALLRALDRLLSEVQGLDTDVLWLSAGAG